MLPPPYSLSSLSRAIAILHVHEIPVAKLRVQGAVLTHDASAHARGGCRVGLGGAQVGCSAPKAVASRVGVCGGERVEWSRSGGERVEWSVREQQMWGEERVEKNVWGES